MKFNVNEHGYFTNLESGEIKVSSQEEYGFRPYQLFVSSVAICSGGWLRKTLQKMRIPFEDITISTTIERNPEAANRIEAIHLLFTIKGENPSPKKIQRALAITPKKCAMIQSIKDSIKIT
ncbi:OsmC family protein [Aquibacillus rhizosphaerae]|uniref:OsmC family protein n=1 Tax=Aquibacillus rhizosphaerae TaxID=3051431 RepID=A0ABT7L1H9_9BACI|nr:OsmC family protein [Aquibacillus sp. LR5S19]MDL4839668.1 OsmC family protein [Aquibacillus sp. LR5S19]